VFDWSLTISCRPSIDWEEAKLDDKQNITKVSIFNGLNINITINNVSK
jgi:hypothetical protein